MQHPWQLFMDNEEIQQSGYQAPEGRNTGLTLQHIRDCKMREGLLRQVANAGIPDALQ